MNSSVLCTLYTCTPKLMNAKHTPVVFTMQPSLEDMNDHMRSYVGIFEFCTHTCHVPVPSSRTVVALEIDNLISVRLKRVV